LLRIDSWAPYKINKHGLRLHRLAETIPWNQFLGSLKGPKLEIFGFRVFSQIIPVWVGDLGARPKNSKL
jgi:hypothetical protein